MPTAFVKSGRAQEVLFLQESGISLVDNQQEITPFQRQILVREKARQNKEEQEQIEESRNGSGHNEIDPGQPNAKSGRLKAIEDSQQERDKFVNSNIVDK